MIKLSDYVVKSLEQYGVKHVFMVSGGGAMHLNDSFGKSKKIKYICNHNEQACAIAAEGYARVNQKLSVVNATTGPGGINCLNGVFGQWTDSTPVLYISGQVKRSTTLASCPSLPLRQLGDQEVDIISVVRPLTKYAVMVNEPSEIKYHLQKAIRLATSGRPGPVWLDIPLDVQAAMIDEKQLKDYNHKEDDLVLPPADKKIEEAAKLLKTAKRPLIIAGHGIRISGSQKAFIKLLRKLKIPSVTTMNGFDIIEHKEPYYIGRIGTVANRAANFVLQNADLVISVGSRNNIRQVSYNWENYAKKAKLICIDIDKAELDKPTLKPFLKIQADVKDFIEKFDKVTKSDEPRKEWLDWCLSVKKKYPPVAEAPRVGNNPIEPYFFINRLTQLFKEKEVIVGGNGTAFLLPFQVGEVKKGQRYIWNSGNASMGYDLPAAIGACLANGEKSTICLAGDGSIMMNLQELQTVLNYNLPIKIFLLNNDGYISIQQTQNAFFAGHMTACTRSSGVILPDFTKLAKTLGFKTLKINSLKNIDQKVKEVLDDKGPVFCEVMLSPGYIFCPKLSAKKLPDGTMVSPSLEDLFPFLERKEFESNTLC